MGFSYVYGVGVFDWESEMSIVLGPLKSALQIRSLYVKERKEFK